MISSLVHADESCTRTSYTVPADNIFVENGLFREAGLMENIAQTAAARAGYQAMMENKPVMVGYIGAVKNLEILSLPGINEELETEVTVVNEIFNVTIVKGIVKCRQQVMAQCEMKIFISKSK